MSGPSQRRDESNYWYTKIFSIFSFFKLSFCGDSLYSLERSGFRCDMNTNFFNHWNLKKPIHWKHLDFHFNIFAVQNVGLASVSPAQVRKHYCYKLWYYIIPLKPIYRTANKSWKNNFNIFKTNNENRRL